MYLIYKTDDPYTFDYIKEEKDFPLKRRHGWGIVSHEDFACRLIKLRERMGLTQKEMGQFIRDRCSTFFRMNVRKYSRWERGESLKRFIKPKNLYVLSRALGVTVSYFTLTRPTIPPVWDANSVMLNPTKPRGDEMIWGEKLHLYKLKALYRAETTEHIVQEVSREAAKKRYLDKNPGAKVISTRELSHEPGILL